MVLCRVSLTIKVTQVVSGLSHTGVVKCVTSLSVCVVQPSTGGVWLLAVRVSSGPALTRTQGNDLDNFTFLYHLSSSLMKGLCRAGRPL